MRSHLVRLFTGLLACSLICCVATTEDSDATDSLQNSGADSVTEQKSDTAVLVNLKNVSLEKDVLDKLADSRQMSQEEMKLLSISTIDSMTVPEFKYHLVDTLHEDHNLKVILVGREYIEEDIIWAASYDGNNNLIDHLQVYYDNAEGMVTILSAVHNNLLSVYDHDDEDSGSKQKPSVYEITGTGRFLRHE